MNKLMNPTSSKNRFGAFPCPTAPKSLPTVFAALLVTLLVCEIPRVFAQVSQDHPDWASTWSASPGTLPAGEAGDNTLEIQTVRLIVHASAGDQALRLRLSNAHGDGSLEVNDFIRNSGEFDGIIECDRGVPHPANPNRIRSDFSEDYLHSNDAGYRAMAESIDLDLFRRD